MVGFEQRGCGRSRPLAIEGLSTLASNTTQALIADIEDAAGVLADRDDPRAG